MYYSIHPLITHTRPLITPVDIQTTIHPPLSSPCTTYRPFFIHVLFHTPSRNTHTPSHHPPSHHPPSHHSPSHPHHDLTNSVLHDMQGLASPHKSQGLHSDRPSASPDPLALDPVPPLPMASSPSSEAIHPMSPVARALFR